MGCRTPRTGLVALREDDPAGARDPAVHRGLLLVSGRRPRLAVRSGAVDGYQTEIAVTGDDTDTLLAVANERDGVTAQRYDDRGAAYDAFDAGAVSAVLDANRNDDGQLVVRATAPESGLQTTLLVVQLRDTLEHVERVERQGHVENRRLEQSPVPVPDEIEASPYVGFTYTILLPLLCFLPVFISGSIVVDSLIEERQRGPSSCSASRRFRSRT